ncbi:MAG: hypothetical protein U9N08_07385 [Candidatus Caldatribacteriota bacterium]|nr:hypothetical protein [Candidatus Caldatribacteriota bacterium]
MARSTLPGTVTMIKWLVHLRDGPPFHKLEQYQKSEAGKPLQLELPRG